jgi:hypothetical protein
MESHGLTRRGLIKVGAAAALVVGAGGAGRALAGEDGASLLASGLGRPAGGAAFLHRRTYVPLIGSDFRILRPGAGTLHVKLIQAKPLPSPGETFSLLFRGPAQSGVAEGVYQVEHPRLGAFHLFLGPVGRGVKGLDLEAVINRIAT